MTLIQLRDGECKEDFGDNMNFIGNKMENKRTYIVKDRNKNKKNFGFERL